MLHFGVHQMFLTLSGFLLSKNNSPFSTNSSIKLFPEITPPSSNLFNTGHINDHATTSLEASSSFADYEPLPSFSLITRLTIIRRPLTL